MTGECPPIPDFLIQTKPVERAYSLPAGHPVREAAIAQRKRERPSRQAYKSFDWYERQKKATAKAKRQAKAKERKVMKREGICRTADGHIVKA